MSEEITKIKSELNRIKAIAPDDNLRYLVNQIELNNIKVSEKDRVLNILNEIDLGIKNLTDKLNSIRTKKITETKEKNQNEPNNFQ
jgi:hypothetical protein